MNALFCKKTGGLGGIMRIIEVVVALLVLLGVGFGLNVLLCEQTKPTYSLNLPTHWNLKDDLVIDFSDESGLRGYEIEILLDSQSLFQKKEVVLGKPKNLSISLPKPPTELKNGTILQYKIKVRNWSNANFFIGNSVTLDMFLTIDMIAPRVEILAHSPKISRSGSALVVFKVEDIALDSIVLSNGKDKFEAFKYEPKALDSLTLPPNTQLFASIIAWPLKNTFFEGSITITDKAHNATKIPISIAKNLSAPLRKSNIKLKENFLESKLPMLIEQISSVSFEDFKDDKERFLFINETIRNEDEEKIIEASKYIATDKSYVEEFAPFYPLKNARAVGFFGDERSYYLGRDMVSITHHMGLDLASVRNAPISASNDGVVTLRRHLGLHGNTIIVYHGFGLSSLYAHLSDSLVKVGDTIMPQTLLGYTGESGWAFGDHLHLEILVQGYPVSLNEWMSAKWVEENINSVFRQSHEKVIKQGLYLMRDY